MFDINIKVKKLLIPTTVLSMDELIRYIDYKNDQYKYIFEYERFISFLNNKYSKK